MLDHFSIFTRSGLVLWDYTRDGVQSDNPASAIDHLIEHVFLEDKLSLSHYECDKYRLQWVFSNEFKLCFVVVFPWNMGISTQFYQSLLELIRDNFCELISPNASSDDYDLDTFEDFDLIFEKSRTICEEDMVSDRRMRREGESMRAFDGSVAVTDEEEGAEDGEDDEDDVVRLRPSAPLPKKNSRDSPTATTTTTSVSAVPPSRGRGRGRGRRGRRQMRSFDQSAKRRRRDQKKKPNETDSNSGSSATKKPRNWSEDLSGLKSHVSEQDVAELDRNPDEEGDDVAQWREHFGVGGRTDLKLVTDGEDGGEPDGAEREGGVSPEIGEEDDGEYDDDDFFDSEEEEEEEGGEDDGPVVVNPSVHGSGSGSGPSSSQIQARRRRRRGRRRKKEPAPKKGFFGNLFSSLTGQRQLTEDDLGPVMRKFKVHLIRKNVATDVARQICDSVEQSLIGKKLGTFSTVHRTVRAAMEEAMRRILAGKRQINIRRDIQRAKERGDPYVIVFCGVNGVGKSTSLAKIAHWLLQEGLTVMMAACDTFRSGAVEQLEVHAKCLKIPLFAKGYGRDSYIVADLAIQHARKNEIDVVLVDTAGRMQDNEPLMQALARLISHNDPDLVLFVGEALVGNQGVDQLVKFDNALLSAAASGRTQQIDGIVLTKFDTIDDKVGAAVSMVYVSGHPIVFIGVGQKYPDLKELSVDNVIHYLMQ